MENDKSKFSRGGRPKAKHKKAFKITGRFTHEEFELVAEKVKYLDITKSEYISKMAVEGKILDTYAPSQKDLVLRLINISNNLNQIAKAANTGGFKQVVFEADALLAHIRNLINAGR